MSTLARFKAEPDSRQKTFDRPEATTLILSEAYDEQEDPVG